MMELNFIVKAYLLIQIKFLIVINSLDIINILKLKKLEFQVIYFELFIIIK